MKNYEAWKIEPLKGLISKTELYKHLIGWAILAPNSHNSQPWKFILRPTKNVIGVCLNKIDILPASDKIGREAYISIGCAIENLVIAASYYRLDPQVELEFQGQNFYPDAVCNIKLGEPSGIIDERREKILKAIKERRVNRGEYRSDKRIPEEVNEVLKKIAKERGVDLNFITDAPTRFSIAQIQYMADKFVVALNSFREELGEFLLPNDTQSGKGMPGSTFGMQDSLALEVHEKLKRKGQFDPDLAHGIAQGDYDGICSAQLLGIISIDKDDPAGWISAGRTFQKIALTAEMNNLAVAVHAAIVEVSVFNSALRLRLGNLRSRPTVIFRMGYPTRRYPHSPRLNIGEVSEVVE